jgi:F0F1-type ATP synthase assembly protein I
MSLDRGTSQVLGLAWGFGWRIVAGVFLGYYLDRWLGSSPLFIVVFSVGSLVAGVADLVRAGAAADENREDSEP